MIVDGWLDWAVREPGPADKVYSERNRGEGLVCHSMEGWGRGGIDGRMMSQERDADGRYTPKAQASWMFSLMADGRLLQHYPVWSSTWTSGNREANTRLWAVEAEGVAGTPLNAAQVVAMVGLAVEWERYTGRRARRNPEGRTVWEHREVWSWSSPNAGPTACPSGRYAPFYAALDEEDGMKAEELARLERVERLLAGRGVVPVVCTEENRLPLELATGVKQPLGVTVRLSGAQTLAYLDYMGNNFWLGLAGTQERVARLEGSNGPKPAGEPVARFVLDVLEDGDVIMRREV